MSEFSSPWQDIGRWKADAAEQCKPCCLWEVGPALLALPCRQHRGLIQKEELFPYEHGHLRFMPVFLAMGICHHAQDGVS